VLEGVQGVEVARDFQDNIAAAPAVAAVRPAARDVLLAPEVDCAVSAFA